MRERCSEDPIRRGYWVLKGVTREFYVCTTAGPSDWRTALCVFDSAATAVEYLRSLGGARAFVEIMQRYGMQIPAWMRREPQLPEAHEATVPELRRVAEGLGMDHITLNPLPVEPYPGSQRAGALALLPVEDLEEPPRRGSTGHPASIRTDLPDTVIRANRGETN